RAVPGGRLAQHRPCGASQGAGVMVFGLDAGSGNRGSHFYLSLYWAQELAKQTDDADLAKAFAPLAETLTAAEQKIVGELNAVQGKPAEIGGYYQPDPAKAAEVMRPSATWNEALASLA
ncbi:NADP-dependent isocitrate dehydrogenase, partial [Streptomyces olivaceus]